MIQNSDSVSSGNCGSFCSECKFVLNSIYSLGNASPIIEWDSITNVEPKDRNSLLNEHVETPNEDIINENDEKLNNSQSKLSSSTPHVKYKDNVKSEEKIQVLLHKKLNEVKKVDKELNGFNEIYKPHDHEKYFIHVKPAIIEDKILQSSEKLKIDNLKKYKLRTSNYRSDHSKYSTSHKAIKNVNEICKGITNDCRDLKNVYGIERQNEQLTDSNYSVIPTYSKSQNTENKDHDTMASEYFSQCNKLKNIILNRRKKISHIAKILSTQSTYLNGICKTLLETEDSNPSSIRPNISFNLSKKVNQSTSPILFPETCPAVTDLTQSQENSYDMYRYNPYCSRNILKKKM